MRDSLHFFDECKYYVSGDYLMLNLTENTERYGTVLDTWRQTCYAREGLAIGNSDCVLSTVGLGR